jgi:CubicO group peptidase (beta-lactamase class C family)
VGYSVIAAIAEQVLGVTYESALRNRLLQAAGIQGIGYTLPDWSQRTVARGYLDPDIADDLGQPADISAIELPWAEDGPYWNLRGNGGLLTSSEDLLKWHDFLDSGQVLSAANLDLYYGRHVDEGNGHSFYGYGWVTEDTPVGPLRHHDGGNDYYYAQMLRFSEKELVIITLSNEGTVVSEELAWDIARAAVPELRGWDRHLVD